MRWYAVHTKPRMEPWARSNLWERGFEVYLPQYRKRRRHARKLDVVAAPLFPRYLFVRADLDRRGARAINGAPGTVGLVAFGGRPAPVADRVIEEIRARADAGGYVVLADPRDLKPGDPVRLVDGPFGDIEGLFVDASDRHRVVLLLSLLGRPVRVSVPPAWLGEGR